MNDQFFAWNLDITDGLTTSLTSQVIVAALGVATICFICNVAYNYASSGFAKLVGGDGGDSFPNYQEIARCVVLVICISSYLPIANTIVGTLEVVNKATSTSHVDNMKGYYNLQKANEIPNSQETQVVKDPTNGEDKTIFQKGIDYVTNTVSEVKEAVKEETEGLAKITKDIGDLAVVLQPQNWTLLILHGLVGLIVTIIKIVIQGVVVVLAKVLVIVGPFAFAFSILPCFKKQLEIWFSTLVTTCMTLTTINILDIIMDAMTGNLFAEMQSTSVFDVTAHIENRTEIIALDMVMIILYCSCFWLTSKYVGKGDAGRVVSKLVSTATTLAAIAVTGGTASGAAAGGSAVQGAANVAKNAIEE